MPSDMMKICVAMSVSLLAVAGAGAVEDVELVDLESALSSGDECAASGEDGARCALQALQLKAFKAASEADGEAEYEADNEADAEDLAQDLSWAEADSGADSEAEDAAEVEAEDEAEEGDGDVEIEANSEVGAEGGGCRAGLVGQIRKFAPSCLDSCPQICGPLGEAVNAFLKKGGEKAVKPVVCRHSSQFACALSGPNYSKCKPLIAKARSYGFSLPRDHAAFAKACR